MLTWTCHICNRERPDDKISVFKKDIGLDFGFPPNIMFSNVRYCNDNDECYEKAKTFQFHAKSGEAQ